MAGEPTAVDPTTVVALKTATLVLGATVTYFALQAYRRTESPPLRALAVGFSLVTVGSVLGGGLHQFLGWALDSALFAENLFVTLGFLVLTWSLYMRSR